MRRAHYLCSMFIKRIKKQRSKDSKIFYQYTLSQTSRVEGKVKQRAILYLGSDPLLEPKDSRAVVLAILKSKIFGVEDLFPVQADPVLVNLALSYFDKYCVKYGQDDIPTVSIPPAPDKAEFHNVDILGLQVNTVKSFGAEHLCKQMLEKLKLEECFATLGLSSGQSCKALIAICARAIFSASEHKTAQILSLNSELLSLYNYKDNISHKQLYATADLLFKHKNKIDQFLYQRITDIFDIEDKLVIFDISNTYFETRKPHSQLANFGRSKEKRNDCKQVVFTGVINAQGFIRHSRIYEGNTADTATLSDMIKDLEQYSNSELQQTVVIDAGIATEDNLTLLNSKGYKYVCVSRKRLKDYELGQHEEKVIQFTDRDKNKVELSIFEPAGYTDKWMYVQSEAKRRKEQSMDVKLKERFIEDLTSIKTAIGKKGGTKRIEKVWVRIGRLKQKHNRVSASYEIEVESENGIATQVNWTEKQIKTKDDKANGVYFIRSNYSDPTEKQLWEIYNTIREVEATFRCLKSDLQIRPIHHQNDSRIESHIYLTILAYQLVNTIRYMLKNENIHHDWHNVKRIMSTHTIQTIELPTDKKVIHLRKPSRPIEQVQQIYTATKSTRTQSAVKKYVVYH